MRSTGTDIVKQGNSLYPQDALQGEWRKFGLVKNRKRVLLKSNNRKKSKKFIVSANQQLWRDDFGGEHWAGEDRANRIRSVLENANSVSPSFMKKLQFDTTSHFLKTLSQWILTHADSSQPEVSPIRKTFSDWNGDGSLSAQAFTFALIAEDGEDWKDVQVRANELNSIKAQPITKIQ